MYTQAPSYALPGRFRARGAGPRRTRSNAGPSPDAACGRTLGEVDRTGVFSGRGRNKGVAGAVVEQSVLGYPADSRQEPDVRIDGVPYEVKTTGLVDDREAPGRYVAKEPMSVTAVSPDRIWREEFGDSAFWHKLEHMVLVYYLYNHGSASKVADTREYASFELLGYDLHEWSDHDRRVLESDWRVVRDFVERVHREGLDPDVEYPKISHELNRRLMYTDTAPKWPNRPRWRLKRATVTQLARECFDRRAAAMPGARSRRWRPPSATRARWAASPYRRRFSSGCWAAPRGGSPRSRCSPRPTSAAAPSC